MILKFDKSVTIEEARNIYNDNVKFITSSESYPNITAIEFSEDVQKRIHKRKRLQPKVTKQANKIVSKYSAKLAGVWKQTFNDIASIVTETKKAGGIRITKEQLSRTKKLVEKLKGSMLDEARNRFEDAFKLGKFRGQIIAGQELDDTIGKDEQAILDRELEKNEDFVIAFAVDIEESLDKLYQEDWDTLEDLEGAVLKEEETKKSRASMYPLAVLGLVVAGTVYAINKAREISEDLAPAGGYWTIHPDEGQGGEVCKGCEENSGKFFTVDNFNEEYQTNDCLTRCRCDLDVSK